ncbi:PadR family transcriptional regulator [Streptomyces sp. NPDC048636]|uniref:PadR family transcriptional regulator n=1 Tax=Streptomyces sp. NPDC048636 TaxID=3155762 RepID=UPI003444E201
MSLKHAILSALLERPSSGLELTRRFDRSIGFFWTATHQQIYRELARLEDGGLIRAIPAERPAQGQRKEYEVLAAGRAELTAWVALDDDPRPAREPLLLRLRAAAVLGAGSGGALVAELERHRVLHRHQLSEYEEIEERDFPEPREGAAEPDRLRHLVLQAGIDMERFWIDWLDRALTNLRE